ncbi:16861_t:CDS:2, partial [Gigaspora margarita]
NPENFLNPFKPKDVSFLDIYQYSNPKNFINTEPKNPENFFGTLESENMNCNIFESDTPVNFLNALESDDLENLFNVLMPNCLEAYYKQINNKNDFEIIEDNNEKIRFSLELEMSFNNWAELDKWLDNHGLESGFVFTITHSEKDKEDKIPRRYVYKYMKGRPYISRKKAHIVKERDSGHHTTGCTFRVNAYWRKNNFVYITKIDASQSSCNKLNNNLRDDNNSEVSSDSENEANQNKRKCSICNLKGHNARTCSSMDNYIRNDDNSEFTSDSEKESGQNKRKCDICNLRNHNAQTCSSK